HGSDDNHNAKDEFIPDRNVQTAPPYINDILWLFRRQLNGISAQEGRRSGTGPCFLQSSSLTSPVRGKHPRSGNGQYCEKSSPVVPGQARLAHFCIRGG